MMYLPATRNSYHPIMLSRNFLLVASALAAAATPATANDTRAYMRPATQLSPFDGLDFTVGAHLFERAWVTAPSSTQAADGLGPLYNARACSGCHVRNGRGAPPTVGETMARPGLVLFVDVPPRNAAERALLDGGTVNNIGDPVYGLQLQDKAIPGHAAESKLGVAFREHGVTLADGTEVQLREPAYRVVAEAYGPLDSTARLSPRLAPPMIGMGLLERIDEADILAAADPGDRDGDGISGRANRVRDPLTGARVIGRFGHKAGNATLSQQVQVAFNRDIGLSVPLLRNAAGDCTQVQSDCIAAADGNSPQYDNLEAHQQVIDLVTLYVGNLAVPPRRDIDNPAVLAGERLFVATGCAKCHRTGFRVGAAHAANGAKPQTIHPYTDLLLHDLGEALADHRPEGLADGREWRTPPLWGIGLTRAVSGAEHYLHDGRALNLLEAILWHGGEAQAQRDAVVAMGRDDRQHLLRFLESL